jgi:hypothetical protein
LRWARTAHDLPALCGVAREEAGERPNRRIGWPRRVSIISLKLRGSRRSRFRRPSSSRLKSHTPGQLTRDTALQTPRTARQEPRAFISKACGVGASVGSFLSNPTVATGGALELVDPGES